MAAIAATTHSIRIGSAGVMLPHYSTLKVAEQFRVLDALAPGRIDLGVGRAPGSDMRTAQLLNPDPRASDRFLEQVRDLDLWLRHEDFPAGHPGRGVFAYPTGSTNPNLWILGSSDYGAQIAAHFGLPYAFAHFITDGRGCQEAIDLYRQRFTPSIHLEKPHAVACVWALTAATEEEAWYQFSSRSRWKMDRNKGVLGALPSPDNAQSMLKEYEKFQLDQLSQQALVGSPESVAKKLRDLADDLELDEIVVITWAHDFEVRAESYRLLADALL